MFYPVDTPESAVEFCTWLHDARQQGRFTSIHKALRSIGKDRQSVQRCKHVYYMQKQDEERYKEVSGVLITSHYCKPKVACIY